MSIKVIRVHPRVNVWLHTLAVGKRKAAYAIGTDLEVEGSRWYNVSRQFASGESQL